MIIEHTTKYSNVKNKKVAVVLHTDLGSYKGTYDEIFNGSRSVSYHYYVRKDGRVYEWVDKDLTAWHSGTTHKPTERSVSVLNLKHDYVPGDKDGWNPNVNSLTIGIAYEGRGEKANDVQVQATAELLKDIEMDKKPLFAHVEITSYKPKVVIDFKNRVRRALDGKCNIGMYSNKELWNELIRRIRA